MSIFTPDVEIDAPITVDTITNPVTVTGTVTANLGTVDGLALNATLTNGTQVTTVSGNVVVTQATGTNLHTVVDNFPVDADAYAQGSTTAGQLGKLEMGAVTTSNPTYVTGTTSPLSLDTLGNLRVASIPSTALVSTVTLVVTTGSNQTLLAANPNRKKAILFFESATDYVKFGAGASTTSYTYKVSAANTTIEVTVWNGQIDMTGTSGKNVLVTELS